MPVLERGTPTPPGALVFVPHDGRELREFPTRLIRHAGLRAAQFPELPVDPAQRTPRMAAWELVPCLISLRAEFNALAPARDKASDGSIGDTAHGASSSDHNPDETGATPYEDSDSLNEVHAIDVDKSLNGSPLTMEQCVDIIVERHRTGKDDRLQNIIYKRRIISRSWGWKEWRAYGGSNAHTEHAHFSARYTTAQERNTSPWGLLAVPQEAEDDDMATISQKDFDARMDAWIASRLDRDADFNDSDVALRLAYTPWQQKVGGAGSTTRTYDAFFGADGMRERINELHGVLTTIAGGSVEEIAGTLSRILGPAKSAEVGAVLSAGTDPATR